jgi:hypothetical protein
VLANVDGNRTRAEDLALIEIAFVQIARQQALLRWEILPAENPPEAGLLQPS